ncbi:helix-turn-helix transcriptional regulator [Microcoleus sp. FACHB-1515]|uniref:LuxR C-terminal-related transcriptional regulator n=1 Tax=Cyanophyceae TaxID=3028117 RepID=UPI001688F49D|nr:LuxR C-terminal-related transcriptional regulator [Microcoleus sp. FACHB-1515]MBD2089030.1 helix-turn-helix transcriptional regulator [Microcoleus sp. FACHB-1515]
MLLYGVLEEMIDGILVITAQGQIKYANQSAQDICQLLTASRSNLPSQIWKVCVALLETQQFLPEQMFILEDEIRAEQAHNLRVRVRRIECEVNEVCLLVTIENRDRNNQSVALAEARRYGLTSRETEVWMLRRSNLSYKAIAAKLHIAIDTVKKHIKNIHAKQQVAMWREPQ